MYAATHNMEGSAKVPVLYMALELSNTTWGLALGGGATCRQATVPAADLLKLDEAVMKAKKRFRIASRLLPSVLFLRDLQH